MGPPQRAAVKRRAHLQVIKLWRDIIIILLDFVPGRGSPTRQSTTWAAGVVSLRLVLAAAAGLIAQVLQVHLNLLAILLHHRLCCRWTTGRRVSVHLRTSECLIRDQDALSRSLKSRRSSACALASDTISLSSSSSLCRCRRTSFFTATMSSC